MDSLKNDVAIYLQEKTKRGLVHGSLDKSGFG